ncbi:hypothetical protein [Williamsia soli]|uniref:hypothetical protein n=1 Tax=Williamsia soli TaxID=364929 RepID=UPI001A9D8A8F|nr:hypothetical protein [Williamsia soli]
MLAVVITIAVLVWIAISVAVAILVGRAIRLRDIKEARPESPDGDDMRSRAS